MPLHVKRAKFKKNKDLDIDDNASHVEGSTTVMSAGETESDSENEPEQETNEYPETPYVHIPEDDLYGTVRNLNIYILKFI